MKRKGFTLWEIIAVLALFLIAAAVLFPVFSRPSGSALMPCQVNLKQIALGLQQYTQDYGGQSPLLAVTGNTGTTYSPPYGWADALQPYLKNTQLYQCPADEHKSTNDSGKSGFTDYWYNSGVAGREARKFALPAQTIFSGDGNDGGDLTDARYNLPGLPATWINDTKSPLYRHFGGANYAFLDGHVKRLTPAQISNASPAAGVFAFATK